MDQKLNPNQNPATEKLYEDLEKMNSLRTQYEKKLTDYSDLETWIESVKSKKVAKTQVEIGTGIYMKAKINPKEKIMLDIGLGFFLEVTLDEAKPLITKRKKFFEGKVQKIVEEMAKVKVNITKFEGVLEDFMVSKSLY